MPIPTKPPEPHVPVAPSIPTMDTAEEEPPRGASTRSAIADETSEEGADTVQEVLRVLGRIEDRLSKIERHLDMRSGSTPGRTRGSRATRSSARALETRPKSPSKNRAGYA